MTIQMPWKAATAPQMAGERRRREAASVIILRFIGAFLGRSDGFPGNHGSKNRWSVLSMKGKRVLVSMMIPEYR